VQGSCFCGSTTTVTLHSCRMLPYLWIPAYATGGACVWCEGKTQMIWILDYLIGQFTSGFKSRASRVTAFFASRVTAFFASRVTAFFVSFKSHCVLLAARHESTTDPIMRIGHRAPFGYLRVPTFFSLTRRCNFYTTSGALRLRLRNQRRRASGRSLFFPKKNQIETRHWK